MTRPRKTLTLLLLGLTGLIAARPAAAPAQTGLDFKQLGGAPADGQSQEGRAQTEWIFAANAAHPGTTVRAALRVQLQKGFHAQSDKPTDEFLVATALAIEPPAGMTVRQVVYPKPVMFMVPGFDEPQPVFEQDFAIGVALEVGAGVAPGVYPITANLEYQACNDRVCQAPETLALRTQLKVVAESVPLKAVASPLLDRIVFTLEPGAAPVPVRVEPKPRPPSAGPDEGCDVLKELAAFTVLGRPEDGGGYMESADFIAFINAAETGTVRRNRLEGKAPWLIVALVLLGGIALNLTPCVLPLIPINLAIMGAGTAAGSRVRGFTLGATYGLAMALAYGVLGLLVILTSSAFGTINSTIWFNVSIALLFVVLGLAMFDVIHIDFSRFQSGLNMGGAARKGTFALAFGMGAVSALLAGACVAPVVIQVIVYASDQYARGWTIALALPFFLGVGMALPWPFAGAGLACLPRPGKWMVRVKQAMGLFILAFAGYYGYLAWEIHDSRSADPALVQEAVDEQLQGGWTRSICQGLATARAEERLVLIDLWATWCKNCYAMDKTTLKDDAVQARLAEYVKIKYQAEDLRASPAREMLDRFGGIGLPHYAILRPPPLEPAGAEE